MGIPGYDIGKPAFWNCYSRMVRASRQAGIDVLGKLRVRGCYIEHSRNVITDRFLRETDADWILWLDDDQTFHEDLLIRMLAHNKKIVVGNYYRKQPPHIPVVAVLEADNRLSPAHMDPDTSGLERVSTAATGCCLCHRSVFEKIPFPWFFNDYSAPVGPVDPEVLVNGMVLVGEDTRFFMMANCFEFKVWCDFSLKIGHIHTNEEGKTHIITHKDFIENYERNQGNHTHPSSAFRGYCH
jgi:hypothetical protein